MPATKTLAAGIARPTWMRSGVTISLVEQARGGPFVFWHDLASACATAARLGFDAVEIFPPSADAIDVDRVRLLLDRHNLKLAAVGTGGGWAVHKLTLTNPDPAVRSNARQFVRSMIDAAGRLGAPAIVGSMQGRWGDGVDRQAALGYLTDALNELGAHSGDLGMPLLFEPLNRYETNVVNTLVDGVSLLRSLPAANVKLVADLFHMNIEEADLPAAIRAVGEFIGHVHLADSNRRPAGGGHSDFAPIARALRDIGYDHYVSAECLPWPDPDAAAANTIEAYRQYFSS